MHDPSGINGVRVLHGVVMKASKAVCLIYMTFKYNITFILVYLQCILAVDVKPQKEKFTPDYSVYHNLSSISVSVEQLVKENPNFIRSEKKYLSREGRNQYLIHMTNFTNYNHKTSSSRVKIFLSFGEHAREFVPVESCIRLIERLLQHRKSSLHSTLGVNYMNDIDLYLLVIANPDGRHLVETRQNYCWRGTKTGVDINRNMDWEFGGSGSSADQQDEEYRGRKPFSEPESVVYRDLPTQVRFDAFLSLHSGIKQIYIPYADTKSRKTGREPENLEEMMRLAKLLSTATRYRYQYGKAVMLNDYTADGTVFDYMAGKHKIPFSYAIELWGPGHHKGASCFDLFNPENKMLQAVVDDLMPLYSTFFDYLITWKRLNSVTTKSKSEPSVPELDSSNSLDAKKPEVPSLTPGYTLLLVVVVLTVLIGLHGRFPIFRRFYQRRRVISLRSLSSTLSINVFAP